MAKNKKASDEAVRTGMPIHGWYGIGLLFVCVSIAGVDFLLLTSLQGRAYQILAAPSIIFVAGFLLYKAKS